MASSHCIQNPPILNPNYGKGQLQQLAGLNTYISGPSDSNLAIILASDVFGYESPQLRKLADRVAAAGYLVVVPDFLYNDPVNLSNPEFDGDTWLKNHDTAKGCEDCKGVIGELKSRGISAIGAAGFCWGGMLVVKLASCHEIQAAVILHPGWITAEEIHGVKVPTAILGAEIDQVSPPELMKQFGQILAQKFQLESYVKIFPGVVHGWTVRYDEEDDLAVKSAEEAHSHMLDWFTKFVKIQDM
ncbi:endo-1,3;1,4-beta-D-glucanase-like [Euphorbia lathyris]|uniref:endo-1,3;1,4-beta-D-glucanase-like n=1 Tax=Euphorbia lathyris TaxID=212925 RepID=UPI0033138ADD